MVEVKIKRLNSFAQLPQQKTLGSAGADLCVIHPVVILPETSVRVGFGFSMEIPEGYAGFILARSGLGSKGVGPRNFVGLIDSDYRGEVQCELWNNTRHPFQIDAGTAVGQMVILAYDPVKYVETDILSDTERGAGGFGSTGK